MFPLVFVLATAPAAGPPPLCEPQQAAPANSPCTLDAMFQSSRYCAGPALYPFLKQPRVCPVAVCGCEPGSGRAEGEKRAWRKEFHTAAHIPFPRFGLDGGIVPGDALVIYEGMRLTVYPETGYYDVTFTATVPNSSVTLRMQLTFTEEFPAAGVSVGQDSSPPRALPARPAALRGPQATSMVAPKSYKLTLPPIRMEPPRDAKPGDPTVMTFNIAHRGYSSLFLDPKCQLPGGCTSSATDCPPECPITCKWTVTRDATARFGTPVAIEDPNR
ncbi:hypothetical protein [Frigoriglobus tundricola]|uniref:Uncharacterized protein n=1 Tax=Frigoriglobus tundricola TaxID=2774151 RepID=A0A6M5YJI2_9BACT|nr:hypothetical protein [Frigoriglobus tundricola]QJW94227.1 hypothetical protein FTUN_1747 [Frigoriglobus tundricola]